MDEQIEKRFSELAQRSWNQGVYCFTHFLGLAEQSALYSIRKTLPPAGMTLFGGADNCERKMLRFGSEENCGYDEPFPIVCLKVVPSSLKFSEELTHRDLLGALMALGIEREQLGDIIVREKEAWLFCTAPIAPYITENFVQARHTVLHCETAETPPEGELFHTKEIAVQLQSERLDALVAHVFKLSRADAQALFTAGKIFVEGRLCENTGYTPKAGERVSVRGFGKFRYAGLQSLSKKGKSNVTVELFI